MNINLFGIILLLFIGRVNCNCSNPCQPEEPFKCPLDDFCIPIQYLCNGAPDCSDGYDEDSRLCLAAKRAPLKETALFLKSLLTAHGPDYFSRWLGDAVRDDLVPHGGVEKVADAFSVSRSVEDFGAALHFTRNDVESMREIFTAFVSGNGEDDQILMLKLIGIKESEIEDVKYFMNKLIDTGFLDVQSYR